MLPPVRVGGPSAVRIATVTAPAYVGRVTGRAETNSEVRNLAAAVVSQ